MTIPFLQRVAGYLLSEFPEDQDKVCIVLPNRRAGLFLRKFLAAGITKPCWAPAILSIEDFLASVSGLREADAPVLWFELYHVHRELEKENARPFNEFLHWAPRMISDFNDVDRHLADPQELFETLSEAKAITLWNPDGTPLTDFEKEYLRFFQSMIGYYRMFSNRLLSSGIAYQGLLFRKAAEMIGEFADVMTYRHVIFAGFNALTRAEEQVFHTLRAHGRATLLWDADQYYVRDHKQEAGEFLRRWLTKWPVKEPLWISDDFAGAGKQISVIGSPDAVGQAKYCGQLLRQLAKEGAADEKTAIVLLDMSLLTPVLNSIPPEIDSLNITAGMPLAQTPVASLFDHLFNMHHRSRLSKSKSGEVAFRYHYKDVLKVIRHPYIQFLAERYSGGNRLILNDVTDRIARGGKAYISLTEVAGEQAGLFGINLAFLEPLFLPWQNPGDVIVCLKNLVQSMVQIIKKNPPARQNSDRIPAIRPLPEGEMEYLFAFSLAIHQLSMLIENSPEGITIPAFIEMLRHWMGSSAVPFSGEPLRGVQLMGMLETRTLDFDNVIILSCNDDLLPSGNRNDSLIPLDLRRQFGLPMLRHRDAVYAYHFLRLIQRASRVWLMFTSEAGAMGGGERSRFIRQIQRELPVYNSTIAISETLLTTPLIKGESSRRITILKDEKVVRQLEELAAKGFSATSLNAYRSCPLKFYYSEIAGIREPEEITESIDAATLGSAVHQALQELYQSLTGQPASEKKLRELRNRIDEAVTQAYNKVYKDGNIKEGKNLLLFNVSRLLVAKLIDYEIRELESQSGRPDANRVTYLEHYLQALLDIPCAERNLKIKIKGIIDRVDTIDGTWKIIDYKTGNVKTRNTRISNWEELDSDPELNIGFQLLMYAYLMYLKNPGHFNARAGIISLRNIAAGFISAEVPDDHSGNLTSMINESVILHFQEVLRGILSEIYDPSVSFTQTNNQDNCRYCPYINLCVR